MIPRRSNAPLLACLLLGHLEPWRGRGLQRGSGDIGAALRGGPACASLLAPLGSGSRLRLHYLHIHAFTDDTLVEED